MHKRPTWILAASWLIASHQAQAADLTTIRGLGMGKALGACGVGSGALFSNPAGMSLMRGAYVLETSYEYQAQRQGHVAHLSVVDTLTSSRVHAGLFYNFYYATPEVFEPRVGHNVNLTKQGHETGLAISVPLGSRFAIATEVRYIYFKTTSKAPSPDNPDEETDATVENLSTVGLDAGLVVTVARGFVLGASGRNLIPTHSYEAPMTLTFGAAYSYGRLLLLDADLLLNLDVPDKSDMVGARFGAELFLKNKFALRAGTWYDGWPQAVYVTAGFGYVHPKVAIELGLAQQAYGGVETRFGLALRFFFNNLVFSNRM